MRNFFRDIYGALDPFGRFWLTLGLISLSVASAMSFAFGSDVSLKHGIFLAVLSVVAAFGPMAAELLWAKGRKAPSIVTAIICIPLLGIEFYSHAGYTAGLRGSNIETAMVQNTKFKGAQNAASDDETNLGLWRQQLKDLQAQAPWAATVKAEGLRDQLKTLQDRIVEEKKGNRGRKAGCGAECERLQNEANALSARISTVEQAATLNKQIEATQRILDGKRDVAAKTEFKSSAVDHQNKFLVKAVALVANGNTNASELQTASAEESVNFAMAVAGTGVPAFCLWMMAMFLAKHLGYATPLSPPVSDLGNRTPETRAYPSLPQDPIHIHTRELISSKALKEWAYSPEVQAMLLNKGQLRAA